MGDMQVKINDDQFSEVIGKAILEQMTPQARDKIISDAIAALNKPSTTGYGAQGPSPLQAAFQQAINVAVNAMVREIVSTRPDSPLTQAINEKVVSWMEMVDHDIAEYDIDGIIAMGLVDYYRRQSKESR